jgi:serine/threonine-protein kinase
MVAGAELPIGSELLGYRIERVLGRGGMGIVYLAEDLRLKRHVALKLLSPELAEDAELRGRLLAESELAASLDHPNIVPIYTASEADQWVLISMRYVEGEDLKQVLRRGPLSPDYALSLVSQVASALDAAHAHGLVHRDVKPSNVLIAPAAGHEGADHAYLADFGLTRRLAEHDLSREQGPLMGTADYVAPEQIRGEAVDGRADVYSLGCLLFECLSGAPPFRHKSDVALLFAHLREQPPSLSALRPGLPTALDSVIAKALAKEPDSRYQTCRELAAAAREGLPAPKQVRSARRRRRIAASGLVVAAAGLAAGLSLTWGVGASSARILIGIAAAKTYDLSTWDLPAGRAFMQRIDEINQAGGVLGRKIDVAWIDTKSDPARSGTSAIALLSKGAVAIIAGCGDSWAAPALSAARARNVPALSACSESTRGASPAVVGPYGGAVAQGPDGEGAAMAEWLRKHRPRWKRAYVLKDPGGAYSRQAADYFLVRWLDLGGEISGEDTFLSVHVLPLDSQLTRLRRKLKQTDVIYVAMYREGATAILQIRGAGIKLPIATTGGVEGIPLGAAAGNPSNVFVLGSACIPSYCSGATPQVGRFFANFKKRYGTVLTGSDAIRGYDLATVLVEAIRKAGSTDGPMIARALFSGSTIQTLSGPVKFTVKCHRPQPPSFVLERYTDGRAKAIGRVYAARIPDIGDYNPCAGPQVRPLR